VVPASLERATGVTGLYVGSAIVNVEAAYGLRFKSVSGASSSRTFTVIDGGAGGTLALAAAFTHYKIGIDGTVLTGNVNGYVTGVTGIFDRARIHVGDPFTGHLGRQGKLWNLQIRQ
jgi:hypothetical protein